MADTQIQQLICNFLTQAQYDALVLAGTVNQNEMYYVTDAKEGANNITITPVGNITATNVQAAIEELDNEKEATANKQNTLAPDGTGVKYPTVDAVNAVLNTKELTLKIQSDITILTTGDGKYIYTVPEKLNNYNITAIHAAITTASTSGLPSFQVYNLTDSVDILSTNVTIDENEYSSYTATTAPVINISNRLVSTGDRLRFDVDAAGTGAKGWSMILTFTKA